MDEKEKMDPSIIKGLFDLGLMGIETSTDHGGAGASFTSAIVAIEELAKVDPSVSVMCDVHNTLVNTVLRKHASKELQDKYLPQLSAEKIGSFALSEPISGSDAFALKTTAKKTSDGYVINGGKMWITNGGEAELFLIFATLDPSKGYKGITSLMNLSSAFGAVFGTSVYGLILQHQIRAFMERALAFVTALAQAEGGQVTVPEISHLSMGAVPAFQAIYHTAQRYACLYLYGGAGLASLVAALCMGPHLTKRL